MLILYKLASINKSVIYFATNAVAPSHARSNKEFPTDDEIRAVEEKFEEPLI